MTAMKPRLVTFTGVDARVDFDRLAALSSQYPVEWGVLVGGRIGKNRYPPMDFVSKLIRKTSMVISMNVSLHACGHFSRELMNKSSDWNLPDTRFNRYQINATKYNMDGIAWVQRHFNRPVIMQVKSFQKVPDRVQQLYDISGGKGISPQTWPAQPQIYPAFVGYAGGISPANVLTVIKNIDAYNYWLDMESGVRTDDWFDVKKCQRVLEKIYG